MPVLISKRSEYWALFFSFLSSLNYQRENGTELLILFDADYLCMMEYLLPRILELRPRVTRIRTSHIQAPNWFTRSLPFKLHFFVLSILHNSVYLYLTKRRGDYAGVGGRWWFVIVTWMLDCVPPFIPTTITMTDWYRYIKFALCTGIVWERKKIMNWKEGALTGLDKQIAERKKSFDWNLPKRGNNWWNKF